MSYYYTANLVFRHLQVISFPAVQTRSQTGLADRMQNSCRSNEHHQVGLAHSTFVVEKKKDAMLKVGGGAFRVPAVCT